MDFINTHINNIKAGLTSIKDKTNSGIATVKTNITDVTNKFNSDTKSTQEEHTHEYFTINSMFGSLQMYVFVTMIITLIIIYSIYIYRSYRIPHK